jgi:hypothetical protein
LVVAHSVPSTVAGVGPSPFRVVIGRGVLVVAVLLAGCSSETRTPTAATTTTQPPGASTTAPTVAGPPTTSSRSAAEAAVLAAYRAYWTDVIAVGKTSNWQSPRLADNATGRALAQARATFHTLKARGLVALGTVDLRAKVLSIKATAATLYDCNSTSNFLAYDAKTGALRDKSSGRRNGKTVTLRLQDGAWKVANVVTEVGRCAR